MKIRLTLVVAVSGALLFAGGAGAANILTADVVRNGDVEPDLLPTVANKVLDVPSLGRFWLDCQIQGDTQAVQVLWTNTTTTPLIVSPSNGYRLNENAVFEPGECCVLVVQGQGHRVGSPRTAASNVVGIMGIHGGPSANVFLNVSANGANFTCRAEIMVIRQ